MHPYPASIIKRRHVFKSLCRLPSCLHSAYRKILHVAIDQWSDSLNTHHLFVSGPSVRPDATNLIRLNNPASVDPIPGRDSVTYVVLAKMLFSAHQTDGDPSGSASACACDCDCDRALSSFPPPPSCSPLPYVDVCALWSVVCHQLWNEK